MFFVIGHLHYFFSYCVLDFNIWPFALLLNASQAFPLYSSWANSLIPSCCWEIWMQLFTFKCLPGTFVFSCLFILFSLGDFAAKAIVHLTMLHVCIHHCIVLKPWVLHLEIQPQMKIKQKTMAFILNIYRHLFVIPLTMQFNNGLVLLL